MTNAQRLAVTKLNEIIQEMNELGGPDTEQEYLETLELMQERIDEEIKAMKGGK